eukprot:3727441-Rhodomonas_salina.3
MRTATQTLRYYAPSMVLRAPTPYPVLRAPYAISGTEVYRPTRALRHVPYLHRLCSYQIKRDFLQTLPEDLVLIHTIEVSSAIGLCAPYAMPGTDLVYGAIPLCIAYAVSRTNRVVRVCVCGTDMVYGPMRVLRDP